MRLTIDTESDSYEEAIAAVQAAYGLRPVTPPDWPEAPAVEPRPGPRGPWPPARAIEPPLPARRRSPAPRSCRRRPAGAWQLRARRAMHGPTSRHRTTVVTVT
ncbi:hypothetical protein GCM10022232_87060 [Streptomyces plumbiresistens]|uniref:Uncharacterized protein n=1 Tax=Streptomyces plumbiresistens TaxID=511811 RepID=A0ABP7TKU4_9ACTN